jgi:beta-phosphoglucomutase-like phosphatase (HAD superfamily)
LDPTRVDVLLCDADGNLFPSELPAFEASAEVTNRCLQELGVDRRFDPTELRRISAGRSFRATTAALVREAGAEGRLTDAALEQWVAEERRAVTQHLGRVLRPDATVSGPLTRLAQRLGVALVSSSALGRLDACCVATGLGELFPPELRFSAEDSLPVPTSKPDPAVYMHALRCLDLSPERGLAIEDSLSGARSALAAGIPTVGNVAFVPAEERDAHAAALRHAGVATVVTSWTELERLLDRPDPQGAS